MKIRHLSDYFSEFPFPKMSKITLTDEDLNVEQLPQFLKLMKAQEIYWKYNAILQGVDGSRVKVHGNSQKEYIIFTPLEVSSIPWAFPRIDYNSVKDLVRDLVPCNEGEGYVNPAPWSRIDYIESKFISMKPGEVTDNLKIEENAEKTIKVYFGSFNLSTNFYNPIFHFLNPFYIQSSRKAIESSSFVSVEGTESISIISSSPFILEFENGDINVQGNDIIYVLHKKYWNEEYTFKINWNLRNPILKIDCKPKYNISLYKIEPLSIVPLYFSYNNKDKLLELSLINMSESDLITTIYFSARIESAEIDGEEITPEFDRIRFPIRRWKIKSLKLKLKKLIEPYLKRKIVT